MNSRILKSAVQVIAVQIGDTLKRAVVLWVTFAVGLLQASAAHAGWGGDVHNGVPGVMYTAMIDKKYKQDCTVENPDGEGSYRPVNWKCSPRSLNPGDWDAFVYDADAFTVPSRVGYYVQWYEDLPVFVSPGRYTMIEDNHRAQCRVRNGLGYCHITINYQ
jgi:hypothetical protein